MQAFFPLNISSLFYVTAVTLAVLLVGFGITRLRSALYGRAFSWSLVCATVGGLNLLTSSEPAGFRMLALIVVLLWAMKVVVTVEAQIAGAEPLPFGSWLAFSVGWFGMRPTLFLELGHAARTGRFSLLRKALVHTVQGSLLVGFAWIAAHNAALLGTPLWQKIAVTILLLPGLSLILHFGILNFSAAFWRFWGVDTKELFRAPIQAVSLKEFWGRRWNIAFSEMTSLALYRPLRNLWGQRISLLLAFLFSGLLHEIAISVPVKAGYGLPLIYFGLHALAMQIEQLLEERGMPLYRVAWIGRAWVLLWLILPLPLLFHPAFLAGVVWPLIGFR